MIVSKSYKKQEEIHIFFYEKNDVIQLANREPVIEPMRSQ